MRDNSLTAVRELLTALIEAAHPSAPVRELARLKEMVDAGRQPSSSSTS